MLEPFWSQGEVNAVRAHICHRYHRLHPWRKICHVEKFQISVKNLNNLWSFIQIYAVFVLICVEKNLCGEKMTKMRSVNDLLTREANALYWKSFER